jgi:uncharacterized protein YcgL (UPF0745 family)
MNGVPAVRVSPNCHFLHNLPILFHCRARHARMQAYVYKSQRKADTFVYLAQRDDFACLPEPLRTQMGALSFVLEVALTPDRKLARGDAAVVRQNLANHGFHIQFPPTLEFGERAPDERADA